MKLFKKTTEQQPSKKPAEKPKDEKAKADAWQDSVTPIRRAFPGTVDVEVPLRIAFARSAYAEVVAHTKENLESEVCGVLVGEVCEDDEPFVSVKEVIRGASTRQGTTHVTFTHETWNQIHATLDKDYPDLQIVGWYHSHPGFGVEFSKMDRFIQENFFTAPTAFALVTDPLGGAVAICCNRDGGSVAVDRFWVEGREHRCAASTVDEPAPAQARPASGKTSSAEIEVLQKRIGQLTSAVDDLRALLYRFLVSAFLLFALAVVIGLGYGMYQSMVSTRKEPQLVNYVPIPIQVGDKVVELGVGLVSWEVPPELIPQLKEPEKPKKKGKDSPAGRAAPKPAGEVGPFPSAAPQSDTTEGR